MKKYLDNKDVLLLIEAEVSNSLKGVEIVKKEYLNLPNNSFILSFNYNGAVINFVKDKGLLETEISYGGEYFHPETEDSMNLVCNTMSQKEISEVVKIVVAKLDSIVS